MPSPPKKEKLEERKKQPEKNRIPQVPKLFLRENNLVRRQLIITKDIQDSVAKNKESFLGRKV